MITRLCLEWQPTSCEFGIKKETALQFLFFGRGDGDLPFPLRRTSAGRRRSSAFVHFPAFSPSRSSREPTIIRAFSQPSTTSKKPVKIKRFSRVFGRGDGDRTHDLSVPNAARYQLRYASIFSIFRYFRKWSNMWSSHLFRTFCRKVYRPNCQCCQGV